MSLYVKTRFSRMFHAQTFPRCFLCVFGVSGVFGVFGVFICPRSHVYGGRGEAATAWLLLSESAHKSTVVPLSTKHNGYSFVNAFDMN